VVVNYIEHGLDVKLVRTPGSFCCDVRRLPSARLSSSNLL